MKALTWLLFTAQFIIAAIPILWSLIGFLRSLIIPKKDIQYGIKILLSIIFGSLTILSYLIAIRLFSTPDEIHIFLLGEL